MLLTLLLTSPIFGILTISLLFAVISFFVYLYFGNKVVTKLIISHLVSIVIVLLFYKILLIYFFNTLSLHWFVPIISSSSLLLTLIIKNHLSLNKDFNNSVSMRAILYSALITFILSSLYLVLTCLLQDHVNGVAKLIVDYIFIYMPEMAGIPILLSTGGFNSKEYLTNSMNTSDSNSNPNSSSGSSSNSSSGSSSNSKSTSSSGEKNAYLTSAEYLAKRKELGENEQNFRRRSERMRILCGDMKDIKEYNCKLIEEEDKTITLIADSDTPKPVAAGLAKSAQEINGEFQDHCSNIRKLHSRSKEICSTLESVDPQHKEHMNTIKECRREFKYWVGRYDSLIDKK